jgi:hypothetical protein
MKKIITSVIVAISLISVSSVSKAQDGRFSIGAEIGIPMGDFGDAAGLGIGGSIRYEAPMGDNIGLTGTAGYISFGGKTISGVKLESSYLIPLQAGLKYYFDEQQSGFYAQAELGFHMYKSTEVTLDIINGTFTTKDKTKAAFSYAPEVGYHMESLDLGLRYQMVSTEGNTTSYLGIRIAYVLGGN